MNYGTSRNACSVVGSHGHTGEEGLQEEGSFLRKGGSETRVITRGTRGLFIVLVYARGTSCRLLESFI